MEICLKKTCIYSEAIKNTESIFYYLLEKEIEANQRLEQAELMLLEQQNKASHPSADDETVEAFSRWLKIGRQAIEEARCDMRRILLEREIIRRFLVYELYPYQESEE